MTKEDFVLKVNYPHEVDGDFDDADLVVSAWDVIEGSMIDDHVSELFPEINQIEGLEEVAEGDFSYYGDLSKEEMIEELIELGFNVE